MQATVGGSAVRTIPRGDDSAAVDDECVTRLKATTDGPKERRVGDKIVSARNDDLRVCTPRAERATANLIYADNVVGRIGRAIKD